MPDFTFTSPEGKSYTVSGPAGATKEQAFQILQGQLKAPPAPSKESGSTLDYMANKFKQGVASLPALGPLAADVVNMPIRPWTRALGISNLGGGQNKDFVQFPATEQYNKAVQSAGVYDPHKAVPTDTAGKPKLLVEVGGNIAEMAGMNIIPGTGAVARSTTPVRAAIKELGSTILSGEGMTAGGYLSGLDVFGGPSESNKAVGEAIGSMTGPMAFQFAVNNAAKGGNWIKSTAEKGGIAGFSDAEKKRQAAQIAAEKLAPQLKTEAAQQAMQRAQDVSKKVPGFAENLTLGRTTGSPAIKSMEHHFASTDSELQDLSQQRSGNLTKSIQDYAQKRFPAPEWDAQSEAKYIHEGKLRSLDEGLQRIDRQERQLAGGLPRGDITDIGVKQRQLITDRMNLARQKKDALYAEVRDAADKMGLKINMADVTGLAKSSAAGDIRRFQDDPGVIGKILRQYAPETPAATVKTTPAGGKIFSRPQSVGKQPMASYGEFESLYKEANREARTLGIAASTGDMQAAQKLPVVNSMRDLLKTKIDEMASPQYGEIGKKLQIANGYYRDMYANLFKRGVGAEILKDGKFGPATENAKITESLIFKKGDPSGVQEFLHTAGNDPRGMQLLENGVFDMLSKKVVRDGKVDPAALRNFLRDYKEPLDQVPNIRNKIIDIQSATHSLQQNTQLVQQGRSALAKSTLARIANEQNPANILSNALKSPKYLDGLLENTGRESRKDLARGMSEMALTSKNAGEFLKTNEAALKKVFGSRQYAYLKTIANAREIAESVTPPPYVQYQKAGDVLEKFGTTVPQMVSEQKAVTSRFAGKEYAFARAGVRWWNKLRNDEIDKLMKSAIYDPEMAKAIADYTTSGTARARQVLNDHMLAHEIRTVAVTTLGLGQQQSDQQDKQQGAQ